jgi:hypothetical protein
MTVIICILIQTEDIEALCNRIHLSGIKRGEITVDWKQYAVSNVIICNLHQILLGPSNKIGTCDDKCILNLICDLLAGSCRRSGGTY